MGTMRTYKYEFYKVGFTLLQRQNDSRIFSNITAVLNLAGLCDYLSHKKRKIPEDTTTQATSAYIKCKH